MFSADVLLAEHALGAEKWTGPQPARERLPSWAAKGVAESPQMPSTLFRLGRGTRLAPVPARVARVFPVPLGDQTIDNENAFSDDRVGRPRQSVGGHVP